jgi:4-aminobutyrate aminotransferase / (S)-3-amino-2-methylpropionate transaminase / 5-aminovalerate transaminase
MSRAWAARLERVEYPAGAARRAAREAAAGVEQAPIIYASGHGSNVYDVDGNRYVDMTAGFGALLMGHGDRRAARALEMQSGRLWHALGDVYPADAKVALLEKLAGLYPEKGARVILGQSGADAITAALKTAQLTTGKAGVVAFEGSYHGLSYAPLAISAFRESFRAPFQRQLSPHVTFAPYAGRQDQLEASLRAVEAALAGGDVGAIVIEPVLGRGGCVPAAGGFLARLHQLTKQAGALLIADEIWTGLGRSGAMLDSVAEGVTPDIVCLGKGLGGGLPLSACIGSAAAMDGWARATGDVVHTATFHGSPLACSTGIALLDGLRSQKLVERSAQVGEQFLEALRERLLPCGEVVAVRGRGLMVGVELASGGAAFEVSRALLASGYIVLSGGNDYETLTLTPPLTIDEALLEGFTAALAGILEAR